ncbi:MAG: AAA family ATPase [Nannocystaceae bacterium]
MVRAKVRALQAGAGGDAAPRLWALAQAHVLQAQAGSRRCHRPSARCWCWSRACPARASRCRARACSTRAWWLRADAIRKELAGLPEHESAHTDVRAGIYTPAWNDRTYDECLARAAAVLRTGGRVVVDASFKEERRRRAFVDLARGLGILRGC